MKEGWKYVKLGECCNPTKNIKWDLEEVPHMYIDLSSVDRETSAISNTELVCKENAPSRAKQIVKKGDIIFATTRPTLRRLAEIDDIYDNEICSTGFCVLRPKVDVLDPRYLFNLLKCDRFYSYIEPLQTGASYPAVTDKIVKNYEIPLPPLPEQQRIVDYLDSVFAKIDALKANTEKMVEEAKALFASALREAMTPKEGWEEKTVGEIFKSYSGGTPIKSHKEYYEGGDIPWLRSGEVCQQYITKTEMHITDEGLKNSSAKYYPVDTVVIAMYGATAAQVGILKIESTSNQAVCGLLPNKYYIPEYVYFWFVSIKDKLAAQAQGGAQPNISQEKIKKVIIPFPPLPEQQRIVAYLDSLSAKIRQMEANYKKESEECNALKQAILREIFE